MTAVTIRPATISDAAGIAKVHVDVWNTTYAGIVPQTFLDGRTYESKMPQWERTLSEPRPRHHLFVAVNGAGQIVGFTSGGANRDKKYDFEGEIYAIYLLKEYQRTGVGRQLFQASIERLVKDEYRSMLLWVLEDNPTCRFYERMGGKVIGEKLEDIGGKQLKELAYGWPTLKYNDQ